MLWLGFLPFIVQAIAITFDEFYFHHKRGLPKWERIGHPIDTLSVAACLAFVLLVPYTETSWIVYVAFAIASCLLVTKDEWVHKEHCVGTEQWLHALLFLNHPLVLLALGLMWARLGNVPPNWLAEWLPASPLILPFFLGQLLFTTLFGIYQAIYWNLVWKK